jgi:hypothetical protein
MKDNWYGDSRDLVKWGVLVHLARQHDVKRIIQVAYYRPSTWPPLEIDGREVEIPNVVLDHFRSIGSVTKLACEPEIQVVDTLFGDRDRYLREVLKLVAGDSDARALVFLDPDTGLAPRRSRPEHVLESELAEIWRQMRPGDVLVFYQHQTTATASRG